MPWRALLRSRALVALCAMYFGAIYGWYFYLTWLPTYLLRARGFDLQAIGWLAALPLLAIALGSLVGGALSDALVRRFGRASACARRASSACRSRRSRSSARSRRRTAHAPLCLAAAAGLAALGIAPAWSRLPRDRRPSRRRGVAAR